MKKELRLQSELNLRRRTLQTVRNKIDVNKRVTYCGGKNFITQVCFIWQGRVSGWLMNDCDLYCSDKDTACNADESRCKSVGVCNQRWPEWSSRQHRAGGWGMRFGVVLPGGPWKGDTIKLQFISAWTSLFATLHQWHSVQICLCIISRSQELILFLIAADFTCSSCKVQIPLWHSSYRGGGGKQYLALYLALSVKSASPLQRLTTIDGQRVTWSRRWSIATDRNSGRSSQ